MRFCSAIGLVVGVVSVMPAAAATKPNVLFIAVDDLKPAVGCYGDRLAKTPNIDRLATRGVVFDHAYCMQAVCAPSRNSLLTGLRPQTLRIYDLGTNFRKSVPEVVTLPQYFKENGYKTEAMGKIFHVGHGNTEDPVSWSVPHWQAKTVGYALPENRVQLTREEALFENKTVKKPWELPKGSAFESADVADNVYGDGKIADEAVARLKAAKENSDQPFFIAVGFLKPHLPFCAPKKYWDMHDPDTLPQPTQVSPPDGSPEFAPSTWGELRQYAGIPEKGPLDDSLTKQMIHGYYAATTYMDAQLGRVLDALDQLELSANTIVVLWGDHGWHLGDHGIWCKHTNYEQATRSPLLFVAPVFAAGAHRAEPVEFVDVYPTLCALAGLRLPTHLQGRSLVQPPDDPESRAAFQVYPRGSKEHGPLLGHAVRSNRWRYVEWQDRSRRSVAQELYDMQNDPRETRNLAPDSEHSTVVADLSRRINDQLNQPHPSNLKLLSLQASTPGSKPKQ